MTELELKYGCNPNQKPARIFMQEGELPLQVLNGRPGYINFMDALNSWQLVQELKQATGLPAAASFKHVSPAGAAVGSELTDLERKIYFAEGMDLSPIASAYVRARGADRLSSYGDWCALSDACDEQTARYLALEVSDGIIAPGYTDEALEILKTKRKGGYNVIQIDPCYVPAEIERRQIFGITFEQGYNSLEDQRGDAVQSGHREQGAAPAGQARPAPLPHHPEVHPVQLGLLREERPDHRRGRRPAEPHPLHPPGGQQGGQLVAAPASQGPGPPVCGRHPPPRPGQRHRPVHLRRV